MTHSALLLGENISSVAAAAEEALANTQLFPWQTASHVRILWLRDPTMTHSKNPPRGGSLRFRFCDAADDSLALPEFPGFLSPGWNLRRCARLSVADAIEEVVMNGLIYLVGLVVVILAVLSFFGLR